MSELSEVLFQYPELAVLTLVILIDWLLPAPNKLSAVPFFKIVAEGFTKKVATKGDSKQQSLAGLLALFVYLFLIITLLLSILFVVENDVWTQGLLLYLSLGYQSFAAQSKAIAQASAKQQKSACRYLLSQFSPYDSSKLSLLGINKLTVETLTIRFVSLWLLPILLFIFIDGVWAFCYRALMEAYFIWLPQRQGFQYFGTAISKVKNIVELVPTWLFAPVFSVFKSSPGWLNLVNQTKSQWRNSSASPFSNLIWLSIVSAGTRAELAGPLMLDGKKIARPRINQGADISASAIEQVIHWINRFRLAFLTFNLVTILLLGILAV